jgi:hypothetical protein
MLRILFVDYCQHASSNHNRVLVIDRHELIAQSITGACSDTASAQFVSRRASAFAYEARGAYHASTRNVEAQVVHENFSAGTTLR